ncbi:MAG: hypothetical protein Q7T08_03025 [Devosia sp.]|nr:hypothetical protein [Devosia sp.]
MSLSFSIAGKKVFFSPVMMFLPVRFESAISASTSPRVAAVGFSIHTWAPASTQSRASPVARTCPSSV